MKYIFMLLFSVMAWTLIGSTETQAQSSSASTYSSYWEFYRNYYQDRNTSSRYVPRYRTSSSSYTRPTTTSTSRRTTSGYRIYPTSRSSAAQTASNLVATVTPYSLNQDINNISSAPVDLFSIGLKYNGVSGSSFTPAAQVQQMQFQIVDNTGVVSDFSDFDLVIEDQNFQFESNGYITLQFNNLRLARGESRALDVQIKLNDPDTFARQSGSFRLKFSDLKAVQENSVSAIKTTMTGRTVSDYVVLNPNLSVSGGAANGSATATPVYINGRALGAGEKAVLMSAKLKAAYDDFLVEKVTVKNAFGNNVDGMIQEIRLINNTMGKTLSTRQFINGVATFDLNRSNQIFIARNTEVNLVFEVLVRSNLPSSLADNRIQLSFNESDVEIFGMGSGKAVPDSSKSFNIDAETFTVNQGGGSGGSAVGGVSFSATQPSFVSHGTLEQIVRFKVQNAGGGEMALGRLSVQAFPSGVEFSGGISPDDAQLVRVVNGFQEYGSGFTTTGASGNTFVFDSPSGLYIGAGETVEFAIKLKLDEVGSIDESDSVSIKILGDSSFNKGTLSAVRSSGANFIWSDYSGSPHSASSTDWLSGYLVSGLPTSNYVRYRR